jgi:N-acetylglucosaminyldiphosphoundecaprenol N-acetyl-beta-D-mannosaminyltransferase
VSERTWPRMKIGRVPVDALTFPAALDALERLVVSQKGGTVFTPNVDHVVLAEHRADFRAAYHDASLSLVDGMPVLWASRLLGQPLPEKLSGSDLVPRIIERAAEKKWSVYLLGGAPGSAARAADHLVSRGVRVAGYSSPRVPETSSVAAHAALADEVAKARADIVLVGLGAPKQELFCHAVRDRVRPSVLLGVGASIDFIAGTVPRAPPWVSSVGFEWLYRLGREPRRLWRRYLLRDPQFFALLLRQLTHRP